MKILMVIFAILLTGSAFAAETIVVGGKPYEVKPTELKVCGSPGSPEYAAVVFLIDFAQSNGEHTYEAACKVGIQTVCTPEATKRFGVQQIFSFIRQYPSGLRNQGCKSLRDNCEKRCKDSKQFDDVECVIECNQYESWNP